MKTIDELMGAMQAIVDLADAETRSLTTEEVETYEGFEADLKLAQKTAELHSRQAAYKSPVTGFPAVIKPQAKGDEALEFAFETYLRTGRKNVDVQQLYAQSAGTDSEGGYTTPPGFRAKLVERLLAFGGIRTVSTVVTSSDGNTWEWPTVDETPTAQTDAGFRAGIAAEGVAQTDGADIAFGTKTLPVFRFAATGASDVPIKVSVELLQDSAFDIGAFVSRALGTRIARKQAHVMANGAGTTAPEGIFHQTLHPGDIATASGSAVTYAKLVDLIHALDPAYRVSGCTFIMNDATLAAIEKLTDGTAPAGRPLIYSSSDNLSVGLGGGRLLGYPVVIDQAAPALANNVNGIAFGDFREAYIIRDVADVRVMVNPYTSANTSQVEYNAWARMGAVVQSHYAYRTLEGLT